MLILTDLERRRVYSWVLLRLLLTLLVPLIRLILHHWHIILLLQELVEILINVNGLEIDVINLVLVVIDTNMAAQTVHVVCLLHNDHLISHFQIIYWIVLICGPLFLKFSLVFAPVSISYQIDLFVDDLQSICLVEAELISPDHVHELNGAILLTKSSQFIIVHIGM